MKKTLIVFAFVLVGPAVASARQASGTRPEQSHSAEMMCPMREAHMQASGPQSANSRESMNQRGEKGMGFSQTAATHHFLLKPNGGVIQVEANDPADTTNRDAIRMHLKHIAHAFQEGDFAIPMFVHDTTPPGVPEMKRLKEKISYSYEETANGGRVVIASTDNDALIAIHQFLKFQIEEHKTADPAELR